MKGVAINGYGITRRKVILLAGALVGVGLLLTVATIAYTVASRPAAMDPLALLVAATLLAFLGAYGLLAAVAIAFSRQNHSLLRRMGRRLTGLEEYGRRREEAEAVRMRQRADMQDVQSISRNFDRELFFALEHLKETQVQTSRHLVRLIEGIVSIDEEQKDLAERTSGIVAAVRDQARELVDQGGADMSRLASGVEQALSRNADLILRRQVQSDFRAEALLSIYKSLDGIAPLPPFGKWAIEPDLAALLLRMVYTEKPKTIVEIGSGLSTILLAYAARRIGDISVIALEHDRDFARATTDLLMSHGLEDHVVLHRTPLTAIEIGGESFLWYDVGRLSLPKDIALLFIDGPPASTAPLARYPALPVLAPYLANDASIVLDDAARADEREILERWQSELKDLSVEILNQAHGTAVIRRRSRSTDSESK